MAEVEIALDIGKELAWEASSALAHERATAVILVGDPNRTVWLKGITLNRYTVELELLSGKKTVVPFTHIYRVTSQERTEDQASS